jgi:hypothetical protein
VFLRRRTARSWSRVARLGPVEEDRGNVGAGALEWRFSGFMDISTN